MPSSNREWWILKLEANASRDKDTDRLLESGGWTVLRLWEHVTASEGADAVETALDRLTRSA